MNPSEEVPRREFVLTLSCPDRPGIVAAVTHFLYERGCNIIDSAQCGDRLKKQFFLRILFDSPEKAGQSELRCGFDTVAKVFGMVWAVDDAGRKTRTLVMVSKLGHCLADMLFRHRIKALPIEIPLIVSNHKDFEDIAAANGIPFHHLPITPETRAAQEELLLRLVSEWNIELIVLARYMQVLSAEFCNRLAGRIINIHHSFLPSFKGAGPYHQAYERGVKLIGATAHYVTSDLDEGPIIEQSVERVNHAMSPAEYAAVGRDIESVVLARAVKWHAERRILLNGARTIVFT